MRHQPHRRFFDACESQMWPAGEWTPEHVVHICLCGRRPSQQACAGRHLLAGLLYVSSLLHEAPTQSQPPCCLHSIKLPQCHLQSCCCSSACRPVRANCAAAHKSQCSPCPLLAALVYSCGLAGLLPLIAVSACLPIPLCCCSAYAWDDTNGAATVSLARSNPSGISASAPPQR